MKKIKIAIAGVGNCACSLIQGLVFYRGANATSALPGVTRPVFGNYRIEDIEVVAAFDVNRNKIGKDLNEAIWVFPTNAQKFAEVPRTGVLVQPGFLLDGVAKHMRKLIPTTQKEAADPTHVVKVLQESGAEMLINYIPAGSLKATRFYAQACLDSGVAFINGIPEFIVSDPEWAQKFEYAGIPCAGDDIQSQTGSTILNRFLLALVRDRGHAVESSYQINIGGDMDFLNMSDRHRAASKKRSKTEILMLEAKSGEHISAAPSDYVPHLNDKKVAYINVVQRQFGGLQSEIDVKLTVHDSANNAGVMVDVIRAMRLSLDRGLKGPQPWSAEYFKHPSRMVNVKNARKIVDHFIAERNGSSRKLIPRPRIRTQSCLRVGTRR